VTRHRLTDLRELLSRTAHVALLTGLGIGLHLLLFDLFEPGLGHTGGILASLGVIGLLFFGTGFNHAVAHRLQRSIVGRRNDYRSVLRESITGIARLLDLDELLGFIITSIRKSLDIDAVRLYLRAHDGAYVLRQGYDAHERIAPPWELVPDAARWIEERKTAVIGEELESEDNGKGFIVQYLRDIDAAVALPLFSKDRMIGVLTLGEKQGGAPYAPGDIDLLETLSGHAAVAIENALLYDRMEERVRERTQELEEARRIAEEANRAKSQFLSNISHELRTPLNAIIGFSEIMKDGAAGPLTPDQQAYSRDIWESGKHLLRIINNLLDLSKIEAGMMTLDPDEFSLKELLEGCLGLFRDRARQRGLTLRAEVGEECDLVTADRTKIKQVALNLIANAVKFTPDGGTIIVSARRLPAAGGTGGAFEVTVADTGIGMTTEEQGRLFRPFVQLDNSLTKKYEGTGLGLHLSSRIIGMHGGAIRVESEPGKGSAFSFSVPQP
jgi:signal transduction histidine kinase